jgi:hypothetical protein
MRTSTRGKAGKKPRTVYLEVGFWRADGGTGIFLASKDPDPAAASFNVLIRKDSDKKSGHKALWNNLNACLEKNGL